MTEVSPSYNANFFDYYGWKSFAMILRVIDGDTVEMSYFLPYMKQPMKCKARLFGIDTPELCPRLCKPNRCDEISRAKDAKRYLKEMIEGKTISFRCEGFDKYGRMLCVFFNEHEENVNDLLIKDGHAVVYSD